jgi:osmotically-inducible protein OsmY
MIEPASQLPLLQKGNAMNDLALRRAILDELEFRPQIDAAAIGVAVRDGVVSLTGHVKTFAEKLAVERAVQSLKGVRAIAEELEVKTARDDGVPDDELAGRCVDVIRWSAATPDDRIRVKVQQGWVSLEGEVQWQYQKLDAERAVRKLEGVTGIYNMLVVQPRLTADDIKQAIEQALQRNAELDAAHIRVAVDGSTVKLEGQVHLWLQRKAAEHAAWAAPGVTQVDNHLLIA